jgi:hypothetical protein
VSAHAKALLTKNKTKNSIKIFLNKTINLALSFLNHLIYFVHATFILFF